MFFTISSLFIIFITIIISQFLIEPELQPVFWMIAFSAALVPLILIPKKHQISRINGFVLTISYGFFLLFIFS